MYACLDEHPDALVPRAGEVDFFSKHYYRDYRWYASQFKGHNQQAAVVDISPTYLIDPGTPARIQDFDPGVKLIFCLRNPIERAYSHYCMHLRGGAATENIDSELNPSSRYLQEGLYHQHIQRYDQRFAKENILFLLHDDLKADPSEYIRRVFSFLEIDTSFCPSILNRKYHQKKNRPKFEKMYKYLVKIKDFIQRNIQSDAGTRIVKWMRRTGVVNLFHRLNRGPDFPDLSVEKRDELADFFREDVKALSERLDRDLTHWLQNSADSGRSDSARRHPARR